MSNWAYFAGLACLAAAVAAVFSRWVAAATGASSTRARQAPFRYYTLNGEYFRARIGDSGFAEIFHNDQWAPYAGDPLDPVELGARIDVVCLPEKARDRATLIDERNRISRQIDIMRIRPNPYPSVPDPGERRPVVGELKQILAEINEQLAELERRSRK